MVHPGRRAAWRIKTLVWQMDAVPRGSVAILDFSRFHNRWGALLGIPAPSPPHTLLSPLACYSVCALPPFLHKPPCVIPHFSTTMRLYFSRIFCNPPRPASFRTSGLSPIRPDPDEHHSMTPGTGARRMAEGKDRHAQLPLPDLLHTDARKYKINTTAHTTRSNDVNSVIRGRR